MYAAVLASAPAVKLIQHLGNSRGDLVGTLHLGSGKLTGIEYVGGVCSTAGLDAQSVRAELTDLPVGSGFLRGSRCGLCRGSRTVLRALRLRIDEKRNGRQTAAEDKEGEKAL
jgi:hypothetical protein